MTPCYDHAGVTIYQGDCLDLLPELEVRSVQTCVTSPPYWGLRDYGVDGQLGLEKTPAEYVERLVEVFGEVRRVLRDDGTLWLNLGDTYMGGRSGGIGASSITSQRNQIAARAAWLKRGGATHRSGEGLKPKDLVGIPWRVALALQADGWWLRSDIIWHKPSPMPESVKDRPTLSHEYVFLLSKSSQYYYDADAIKEPVTGNAHDRGNGVNPKARMVGPKEQERERNGEKVSARFGRGAGWRNKQNPSFSSSVTGMVERRNRRTVWTVSQEPFNGAHFATFPTKLIEPCILAGSPVDGTVLDPFAGAGTTALVAKKHNRKAILCELNPDYIDLAADRLSQDVLNLQPRPVDAIAPHVRQSDQHDRNDRK